MTMETQKCSDEVDLNEFFRSMSDTDQEETDWRLHMQFVLSKIHLLSSLTEQEQHHPIKLRVFGSSAEDLKCFTPNDIGDIDIMVYPVAEEAIIDDSVIEYIDGISPIYVRLRGKSHPVLQHCLIENSDYVSTSSLKEFHPKLFGEKFLNVLPKIFDRIDCLDPGNISSGVVNNPSSPSCQVDLMHSFGSLTKQVQEQGHDVFERFQQSDDFRNLLEWFAVSLNPSRVFTEEHSECIDEYLEVAQGKTVKFKERPNVENYFEMLNEFMSSNELVELKEKVKGIDQSQAKDENLGSALADSEGRGHSDFNSEVDVSRENDEVTNTNEKATDPIDICPQHLPTICSNTEASRNEECNAETVQNLPEVSTPSGQQATKLQKKITQQLVDGIFGGSSSISNDTIGKHEKTTDCIQSGIDLVPALKATGWPIVASEWPTRHGRAWPSQPIVLKILDSGFHMVVKTPQNIDPGEQLFRLSFSCGELILSGELNTVQRECYRCLKILYRFVVKQQESKVLTTYFLKNILYWTLEETDVDVWSENNRAACVLKLLERLWQSLETKFLPHYFVPQYNLLEEAVLYHPKEVEHLAGEFRRIYENPTTYSKAKLDQNEKVKKKQTLIEKNSTDPQRKSDLSESGDVTASKGNTASSELSHNEEIGKDVGSTLFLKYADFVKIYKEICKELIHLVLQEANSAQIEDPTVKVILDNLHKVASKMEDPETELMTILSHNTQGMYSSHIGYPGSSTRQRILEALKEQSKMFAYIVAQDDLLQVGKEHLIIERMMNSGTFDMSSFFANYWDVMKQTMGILDPPPFLPSKHGDEDIPLD